MDQLKKILSSEFLVRDIDLQNEQWHHGLTNKSGWYFIETNTPIGALMDLPSPPSEYTNEEGELKKCRNYNIPARAKALESLTRTQSVIISGSGMRAVYSGMAKNILNRAREHTFAHQGTAGLALSNYPPLLAYTWKFHYIENTIPPSSAAHNDITLKLGEQIWRAVNGWPLLCSG